MIVHLCGPSGSGKDTVALMIQEILSSKGIGSKNIKFSRSFKSCLEHLYGLEEYSLDGMEGKNKIVPGLGITFLDVLKLGWTDSQQTIFGKIWLNVAQLKIQAALDKGEWVLFTDIRQQYEANLIGSNPEWLAKYIGIEIQGRGQNLYTDELALKLFMELDAKSKFWPYTLVNSGDLNFLRPQVDIAMAEILKDSQIKVDII
jgi:energy-coupling factor transporter ATP-binding protein EcfA2